MLALISPSTVRIRRGIWGTNMLLSFLPRNGSCKNWFLEMWSSRSRSWCRMEVSWTWWAWDIPTCRGMQRVNRQDSAHWKKLLLQIYIKYHLVTSNIIKLYINLPKLPKPVPFKKGTDDGCPLILGSQPSSTQDRAVYIWPNVVEVHRELCFVPLRHVNIMAGSSSEIMQKAIENGDL